MARSRGAAMGAATTARAQRKAWGLSLDGLGLFLVVQSLPPTVSIEDAIARFCGVPVL